MIETSTLITVKGTEIKLPEWNLNRVSSILNIEGVDFIYTAQITEQQSAIIHYCDTEQIDPNSTAPIPEKYEQLYVRKLLIPLSQEDITLIRTGKAPMQEVYLRNPIYLIEGTKGGTENIRCWTNLQTEFLQQYLPEADAILTEEFLSRE